MRAERGPGCQRRVSRLQVTFGPGHAYLVGQGVAGEVAGVHVYGQELAYVEDPVR
jgi:hypothetical protein